jgi:tetratricopeptide (TPR) repeat protein
MTTNVKTHSRNRLLWLLIVFSFVPSPSVASSSQQAGTLKKTPDATKAKASTSHSNASNAEWQTLIRAGDAALTGGNFEEAKTKYEEALASAEKLKDDKAVITCLTALSNCVATQDNQTADEQPLRERALELAKKTYGATTPQYASALAELADLKARQGDISTASDDTDRALAILGQSEEKYPLEMATCYQALANRQMSEGTPALADDSFKKALSLRTANLAANDPALLDTCKRYTKVLKQLGRKEEASKLEARVTSAASAASGGSTAAGSATAGSSASIPSTAGSKTASKNNDNNIAVFSKLLNDAKEADKAGDSDKTSSAWKLVVDQAEKLGAKDARLPYALVHLADAYRAQKKEDEAIALLKRAQEIREQQSATKTLGMARNLSRLAIIELQNKNYSEAERLFSKALELEDQQGAPDLIVAVTLQYVLMTSMAAKDQAKTEEMGKRLLPLAEKEGGTFGQMQMRMAAGSLGAMYMKSGRMNEGMQLIRSIAQLPRPNQADVANSAKESYAAVDVLFDKAEEATFPK